MIKNRMKQPHIRKNTSVWHVLNAQQYALKLIANVTYGYVSAGATGTGPIFCVSFFTVRSCTYWIYKGQLHSLHLCQRSLWFDAGRMPCSEIADAIVEKGRLTLHNAIHTVQNHKSWDAEVVYGDTDSLFVLLKGQYSGLCRRAWIRNCFTCHLCSRLTTYYCAHTIPHLLTW